MGILVGGFTVGIGIAEESDHTYAPTFIQNVNEVVRQCEQVAVGPPVTAPQRGSQPDLQDGGRGRLLDSSAYEIGDEAT